MKRSELKAIIKECINEAKDSGRIAKMRTIVKNHQHEKIDGVLVDATSANVYVQVYDALSSANRSKMESLPIKKAMDIVWKLTK